MAIYRIQYEGSAEPFVSDEVVTADKWHQPALTPVRRASSFVALAATLFFVPVLSAPAEVVTVDKWHAVTATPVRKVAARPGGGSFDPPAREALEAEVSRYEWSPSLPDAVPGRKPLVREGHFGIDPLALTRPETVFVDKYHVLPVLPRYDARRQQHTFPSFTADTLLHLVPGVEAVTLDKWFHPLSFPVRRREARPAGESFAPPSATALAAEASTYRWHGVYPDRAPRSDQRTRLYPSSFEPPSRAALEADAAVILAALGQQDTPTLRRRVAPPAGLFEPPSVIVTLGALVGQWSLYSEVPPRRARQTQAHQAFTGPVEWVGNEDAVARYGWRPVGELVVPARRGRPQLTPSASGPVIVPGLTPLDPSWLAQTVLPVAAPAVRRHLGPGTFEVLYAALPFRPELATADLFVQRPSFVLAVRRAPHLLPASTAPGYPVSVSSTASGDGWDARDALLWVGKGGPLHYTADGQLLLHFGPVRRP